MVVRVHSQIEDEQTEDEVIASFARALGNRPLEESRRILEGTLNVIAMKKGHSIVIYIYCRTLKELLRLEEMQLNGSIRSTVRELFARFVCQTQDIQVTADNLKTVLESTFSQILDLSEIKKTSITSSEKEIAKCIPYFISKYKSLYKTCSCFMSSEAFPYVLQKTFASMLAGGDELSAVLKRNVSA